MRIRLPLVQRLLGGGNRHGRRYVPVGGQGKGSDGVIEQEFEVYEKVFRIVKTSTKCGYSPGGECAGGVEECSRAIQCVEYIINSTTLLKAPFISSSQVVNDRKGRIPLLCHHCREPHRGRAIHRLSSLGRSTVYTLAEAS